MTVTEPEQGPEKRRRGRAGSEVTPAQGQVMEVSGEPVYVYDLEGRCRWVNEAGARLLGLDAGDVIGKQIFQLFPDQTRFQIRAWRRIIEDRAPSSFLSEGVAAGQTYQFQTTLYPVTDGTGRVHAVVGVGRRFAEKDALQLESEMRGAELTLVQQIASIVTSSLDISEVYERFAAEFRKLVDFDRIAIALVGDDGEAAVPAFVSTSHSLRETPTRPLPINSTALGWVVEHQRTHIEPDLRAHRQFELDDMLASRGIRSIMRVPLITRNGVIGIMVLASFHPGNFGRREQAMAERVAAQIAPAIENASLYQEAQEYAKELEVIDEIAGIVTSSLRIEEVYERFASEVKRLVDFDRLSIVHVDEENQWATAEYCTSPMPGDLQRGDRFPLENTGVGWMVAHRASLIEPDLEESSMFQTNRVMLGAGFRSLIRTPFICKERVIGGFTLASRQPRAFGPRERRILERLAAQIAPAIENARLYWEAQQWARELEVIDEIASIMTSSLHIEQVYQRFASEVKRLVDFDRMTIILVDQKSQNAVRAYTSGLDPAPLHSRSLFPLEDSGILGIIERSESVVEPDLSQPGGVRFAEDQELLKAGIRSGIRVPLVNKNRVVGVFSLWSRQPNCYGPRERSVLERLAAQIAPAIENARLYEELEQAFGTLSATQEQLVRVERLRAMGELASGVAHDLNNALAAILGRTQLLLNQVNYDPHLRSLQVIEQAAHDSAQVVRRILNFARLESETEVSSVNVNSLVEDVLELTRHKWYDEAHSKGQVISVTTEMAEVPPALANYSELREVLTNLVINACEAIRDRGQIVISTSTDGQRVVISVADTGIGMSPEVKQRAFDPFFTTKGASGTGLGLSVALGIISRFNGTIEIDSQEGAGTTVHLSLLVSTQAEEVEEAETESIGQATRTASILVVEDEVLIRETLSDMLALGGHQVTLAASGEEGIELFESGSYDIVFTDLGMPGLSGWEVARAIKQRRDVPVVMVTGWGAGIDPADMEENGVDEVLPKPFEIGHVLNMVQQVLDKTSGSPS